MALVQSPRSNQEKKSVPLKPGALAVSFKECKAFRWENGGPDRGYKYLQGGPLLLISGVISPVQMALYMGFTVSIILLNRGPISPHL